MADLTLQEIDDEIKRDQFALAMKRYAPMITAGVIALLLAVGGWQGWRHWQEKQQLQAAESFYEASQKPSAEAFAALAKDTTTYGVLAQLATARSLADADKPAEAIASLLALAENSKADPALAELARLQAAYLALEKGDASPMVPTLEALAKDSKAVFPGLIQEWLALWYWKQGDSAKALALLEPLAKDPSAPPALQQRAEQMAMVLSAQAPVYQAPKVGREKQ
jgi:hypothetical protein